MSRTLALKLDAAEAIAVVVRNSETLEIERVGRIPLATDANATQRGKAIHATLAPWKLGRMRVVLAASRGDLGVQNFDLPPVPAEDLPDLVHMQAQRDLPLSEDGEGFDFIPLAGDESHAYRVLGMGMPLPQWTKLCETLAAADLKIDQIIPESMGWVELGRRGIVGQDENGLTLFAAIVDRQAVVWATEGDSLRLMRTVWLPADETPADDAAALGHELRRTLLSLAQLHVDGRGAVRCAYVGMNADEIAGELGGLLSKPVQAIHLEKLVHGAGDSTSPVSTAELVQLAPLAALGGALADRRTPLVDLLHPHRRPPAPSRSRTYALAAAAALAGAGLIAWQAYRNLNEPLAAAARAQAELKSLEPLLESYAVDETRAMAIRNWLGTSTNLLTELDHLGMQLRPEPLASEKFPAEHDLAVTRLGLTNRQLTFSAVARNNEAIPLAERRLRSGNYRVDRGVVEPKAEGMPGYNVTVSETLERTDPAPVADAAAGGATP